MQEEPVVQPDRPSGIPGFQAGQELLAGPPDILEFSGDLDLSLFLEILLPFSFGFGSWVCSWNEFISRHECGFIYTPTSLQN